MNKEMEEKGIEVETKETVAVAIVEEGQEGAVMGFDARRKNSKVDYKVYSTITDKKVLFNLNDSCDSKLNDCVGEKMRVVDAVVKVITKPLDADKIEVDDDGVVIKDTETTMITILLDCAGKSYVTASKSFAIKIMNFIQDFGQASIKEGVDIEITKVSVKNSTNKALSFKLL